MHLSCRPYTDENDLQRVIYLLLKTRINQYVERYPTIWRLRLLLDSRLWEPERDALVWKDTAGNLVGFAFLYRRSREGTSSGLEWIMHPQMQGTDLRAEMLAWAQTRVREIATERQETASLDLAVCEDEAEKRYLLEHNSFSLIQDAHNWYMACPLDMPLPELSLPEGFTVRPVTGEDEDDVKAYEAVYGFAHVKRPHRLALLRNPDYHHLVAIIKDGTFIAYCEVSISRREWALSGQRVGWIDYVATHEDFQRQGLGKAMTLAGLRQLQTWGAERALLITMSSNTPAQNIFKASGFHYNERDFCYTKTVTPKQSP